MPSLPFPLAGPLGDDPVVIGAPQPVGRAVVAVDKLVEQYRNKANLAALLTVIATEADELHTVFGDLGRLNSIDDNVGVQLDHIGAKIGEPRLGWDDGVYRLHLKARVILNRSSGTTPDILRLFRQLMGDGVQCSLKEFFPAGFELRLGGLAVDNALAPYLVKFLGLAKAGGVKAILRWLNSTTEDAFTFAGGVGKGFNDGVFASAERA
jgi:hypothetical protein